MFTAGGWPLWTALGLLVASHAYSFFANTVGRKEYLQADVRDQMAAPYGRILLLQIVVIAGAAVLAFTGAPRLFAALVVVLKTAFDVAAHLRERRKLAEGITPT